MSNNSVAIENAAKLATAELMADFVAIPDPLLYARRLPREIRRALLMAYLTRGGWRVDREWHSALNEYSLVDIQKPYLSAFGTAVMKAVQASKK